MKRLKTRILTRILRRNGKIAAYSVFAALVMVGMAEATLDQQVTKATDIVLGNLASLVVGGGTAIGGGVAVFQGNIILKKAVSPFHRRFC
jgi:hypothetical protein